MKYQQWNIAQRSQEAYKAMERQGVPTLVAATLCARGMTDLAEAKGLLSSGEDQLQDPFLMKDMDLATARIGRALRNGEKIAVYGDYDVDGITSTCLLTHYLRAQGGDVCYYIPNRLSEGYGVNREAVEELARQGVRLMITVDCGITAVEEVAYASGLGIDVIITDHHECKEEIPAAAAAVWGGTTAGALPAAPAPVLPAVRVPAPVRAAAVPDALQKIFTRTNCPIRRTGRMTNEPGRSV